MLVIAISTLLVLTHATSAPAVPAQDQQINEWNVLPADAPGACIATSSSSETTLGLMVQKDGQNPSILMTDAGWTTSQPTYRGTISFDGWATSSDVEFFTITKDGGQALVTAEMPRDLPANFKKQAMLFVRVERLGFDDSFNITDGGKIWAALEDCAANKK